MLIRVLALLLLPPGYPPLINSKRDLMRVATPGAFGSIIYIYVSIIILNKAYY